MSALETGTQDVRIVLARRRNHRAHWTVPLPIVVPTEMPLGRKAPDSRSKKESSKPPKKTELQRQRNGDMVGLIKCVARKKHTLVLDIDHTLLAFCERWDHENSRLENRLVILRPHVGAFLKEMHELFEVVLWTASNASHGGAMTTLLEEAAGLQPSACYDATVPWGFFDSPELVSADEAATMRFEPDVDRDRVNWCLLTAEHVLEPMNKMKFIPILGRDASSVIMIDDNVRSFTLTPRAGVKINAFYGKATDSELDGLLPMLRAVANADNAVEELDHWRPDEYIKCDNFEDNMNLRTEARKCILGAVLSERRNEPIPALVQSTGNETLTHIAMKHAKLLFPQAFD